MTTKILIEIGLYALLAAAAMMAFFYGSYKLLIKNQPEKQEGAEEILRPQTTSQEYQMLMEREELTKMEEKYRRHQKNLNEVL